MRGGGDRTCAFAARQGWGNSARDPRGGGYNSRLKLSQAVALQKLGQHAPALFAMRIMYFAGAPGIMGLDRVDHGLVIAIGHAGLGA